VLINSQFSLRLTGSIELGVILSLPNQTCIFLLNPCSFYILIGNHRIKNKKKAAKPVAIKKPVITKPENLPCKEAVERACEIREELLKKVEMLGDKLPPNTLDQLIDELGGPENVAEVTTIYFMVTSIL